MLEMPDQLAGVGIERERGVGVQAIVGDAGLVRRMHQRTGVVGLRRSEEDQVQRGIVAAGGPHRSAAALLERQPVPTVAARLAGLRDGVKAPGFLAGGGIQRDDHVAAGPLAFGSDDHLAFGHERTAGDLPTRGFLSRSRISWSHATSPVFMSSATTCRSEVSRDDVIAIDGHVALDQIEESPRLGCRQLPRILPQQVARDRIQSLHVIAGAVHEDDAIVDQRRGFVGARE